MEERIVNVINEMSEVLNISQLKRLQEVILKNFADNSNEKQKITNNEYLSRFIEAKRIEGCSDRTIAYYRSTAEHFLNHVKAPIRKTSTEDIRKYLIEYQLQKSVTEFLTVTLCVESNTNPQSV